MILLQIELIEQNAAIRTLQITSLLPSLFLFTMSKITLIQNQYQLCIWLWYEKAKTLNQFFFKLKKSWLKVEFFFIGECLLQFSKPPFGFVKVTWFKNVFAIQYTANVLLVFLIEFCVFYHFIYSLFKGGLFKYPI